jgi:phosphonate transport system permease protein
MSSVADALAADHAAVLGRHAEILRRRRRGRVLAWAGAGGLMLLLAAGLDLLGFSLARIVQGIGELGRIATLMLPPAFGSTARLVVYLNALGETLAIALLGTLVAALLALPLGFLAARNVLPLWLARFLLRRGFDTLRAVDTLVWALIWINVVGLGPFAGVLALITVDLGLFGKLFSEAIEAADRGSVEGVASAGANAVQRVRFGLLPQVMPVILSQVLYIFESNTRSATIIGIVGAGGIGLHIYEQIRTLEWQHVAFLVLMVLAMVAIIDAISGRLRFALIGRLHD